VAGYHLSLRLNEASKVFVEEIWAPRFDNKLIFNAIW
jgi:hypothetical protein